MSTSTSYTHSDHARLCRDAAKEGRVPARLHVQALIGRTVCCARIVTAWDTADGIEMWQLDLKGPIHGRMSAPTHRVRQCDDLDGRCTCALDAASAKTGTPRELARASGPVLAAGLTPNFCQAGVVAPPDSLMDEKTPPTGATV